MRSIITSLIGLYAVILASLFGMAACKDSNSPSLDAQNLASGDEDLLVYQSEPGDTKPAQLYKLNRRGESSLLSTATEGAPVLYSELSPDKQQIAYWYESDNQQSRLAILALDNGQSELPAPRTDDGVPASPAWLPDSSGLIYTVFDANNFVSSLFHATVGQQLVEIAGLELGAQARIRYEISADGSRLAMLISKYEAVDVYTPESASLYVKDFGSADAATFIATTSSEANAFSFAWSPDGNELLYQQRLRTEPFSPFVASDSAAGPLMLLTAETVSHGMPDVNFAGNNQWTWLDARRILISAPGQFAVVRTDGSLIAVQQVAGSGGVFPSPDHRRLAFLDGTAVTDPSVLVLDLETNELRTVGPGSSIYFTGGIFLNSMLRWSADSSWLAWDRSTDLEQEIGELYAYDFSTNERRRLTENVFTTRVNFEQPFNWLPADNVLEYLVRADAAFEFIITDMAIQTPVVVGEMATLSCRWEHAWLSSNSVLWNRCGNGVYLTKLDASGLVRDTKLLDQDISRLALSSGGGTAVMQPTAADDIYPFTEKWLLYEVDSERMLELEGTADSACCGSWLQ